MGYSLVVGIAALCITLSYASANDSVCFDGTCEVQVTIDSGPVCGRVLLAENATSYYSFRGIPYAMPPTGSRRFQAPEAPEPWTEPLYATIEGPACPQRDIFYGILPVQIRGQSEDCLYANVHVPATADLTGQSSPGLPVLVFIHGGAFTSGSGNSDMYGPDYLVHKGVIVITFNYRLGVLGFLSLNTTQVPGNAGLRDMVELLNWVKRNVHAFGGNPDDITLMGQSAGAASVNLLMVSEAAQGLFNKTIIMSGTAIPSFYSVSPSYSQYVNNLFFSYLGINSTDTAVIYEQLVNAPVNQLLYAASKVQYMTGICTFVPIIEDEFPGVTRIIDDDPITLMGKGRGKDYPTLLSFTTNEVESFRFVILVFNLVERAIENAALALSPRLTFSLASDVLATSATKLQERYFNSTVTDDTLITALSDGLFKYVCFKLAEWRALQGGAPLYLHQFGYESEYSPLKYGLWIDYKGAAHADDLTYILRPSSALQDYVSFPPQTNDDEMKDWMTNFVINFISCSNPTCMDDDVSPWPPVSSGNLQYQLTDAPSYKLTQPTTEETEMIEFFDSIDTQVKAMSDQLSNQ